MKFRRTAHWDRIVVRCYALSESRLRYHSQPDLEKLIKPNHTDELFSRLATIENVISVQACRHGLEIQFLDSVNPESYQLSLAIGQAIKQVGKLDLVFVTNRRNHTLAVA